MARTLAIQPVAIWIQNREEQQAQRTQTSPGQPPETRA
jgi:hypothetical protein